MIVKTILGGIFNLLNSLINLMPDFILSNNVFDLSNLASFIEKAFIVFPFDLFVLCVSNISFWLAVQMGWAIFEWCYKKIPGIN